MKPVSTPRIVIGPNFNRRGDEDGFAGVVLVSVEAVANTRNMGPLPSPLVVVEETGHCGSWNVIERCWIS